MEALLASLDSAFGLVALAVLAFSDTLIGVGFFVFGEIAFLAAGAAFASSGNVLPALVVMIFAFAGDAVSYGIGKRWGSQFSKRFLKRSKRRKVWRRAKMELETRGMIFVVISRFLGPVAWVTPFLAGSLNMPSLAFFSAAALGVVLGVGQFLIYGALGATAVSSFLPFVLDHIVVVALSFFMLLSCLYFWRRSARSVLVKTLLAASLCALMFATSNFAYFFVFNTHDKPTSVRVAFQSICEAASGPFVVEPGETNLHLPQPVNVILLSDFSGADLMSALGWYRNKTFSHDHIGFMKYVRLVSKNTPPVSELYLQGIPADSAHQMPGTLKVREHIRWWNMGAGVHFGAISKTDEIAIKYYAHLPVLLHDIEPKVDLSRSLLAEQIEGRDDYHILGLAALTPAVEDNVIADFETDGSILVIAQSGFDVPAEVQRCFRLL